MCVYLSGHGRTICAQVGVEETHSTPTGSAVSEIMKCAAIDNVTKICSFLFELINNFDFCSLSVG